MTPYRELPSALAPAAGIPWRRWLVAWLFDGMHPRVDARRWAGGRWALLPLGPDGTDPEAERSARGERWWRSWSAECQQWTPVADCPHGAGPCTCEVHPTPRPLLALIAGSTS